MSVKFSQPGYLFRRETDAVFRREAHLTRTAAARAVVLERARVATVATARRAHLRHLIDRGTLLCIAAGVIAALAYGALT